MKQVFIAVFILFLFQVTFAQDFNYIGVKKCATCHKPAKIGNQFGIWSEGSHAKAFEVLKSEEAKKVATKMGIADPATDAKCLKCHVTGFAAPAANKEATLTQEEGVSCEACHGPGSGYKSMKVMKQLVAGEVEPASVGLIAGADNFKAQCVKCHNEESPTYKPFVYEESVKKIAHPMPK